MMPSFTSIEAGERDLRLERKAFELERADAERCRGAPRFRRATRGGSAGRTATTAPFGMRGTNRSSAHLVGSYRSKSRYSSDTTRCGFSSR